MGKMYYTNERNVQIVISLLKAHGIRLVIASPGTTNMTFVGSIQNDPWFTVYSSVDERSAAYIACGLAEETGEPVVLSCTGATASRNYMPGLTEAYYRKLPVLAITSHRGVEKIGHLIDQQIDRRNIPNDIARVSVTVPHVHDIVEENHCIIEASKAILELYHRGGGPAHINLLTKYSKDFSVKELPPVRVIKRIQHNDKKPLLSKGERIGINIGSHKPFSDSEMVAIDRFCETYNAFVIFDKTSGYKGKYGINYSLLGAQKYDCITDATFDILIHIGEVSGDSFGHAFSAKEVWRVSEDGELRDTFGKLTYMFELSEREFFLSYTPEKYDVCVSHFNHAKSEYERVFSQIPELPFGNIWIAQTLHDKLPLGSELHVGIFNSLRSWDFFEIDKSIKSNCNVGGFGIDGAMSTLVGASLANKEKLYFGVFGDLAFFYDMNVLGNRHVGNNLRILLINNGRGNEFRLSMHPCNIFGDDADAYLAAAGHFGNKSVNLVKHYSEDLGFEYLTASNKEEFKESMSLFLDPQIGDSSIIFEVFTEMDDERNALDIMMQSSIKTKNKIVRNIANSPIGGPIRKIRDILK